VSLPGPRAPTSPRPSGRGSRRRRSPHGERRRLGPVAPAADGAKVSILTDKDPQALELLRHSSAHVLATAVRQLFPHAQIGFGPRSRRLLLRLRGGAALRAGRSRGDRNEDGGVVKADYPFVREEVDRAEAKRRFKDDPLKLERIEDLGPNEVISVYTDGPFLDLCRGRTCRAPGASSTSSCSTPPAPIGAATSAADAAAHLRNGLVHQGRPRGLPAAARGGQEARPPRPGEAARSVSIQEDAGRGSSSGTPRAPCCSSAAPVSRGHATRARLLAGVYAAYHARAAVPALGHLPLYGENQFPPMARAKASRRTCAIG